MALRRLLAPLALALSAGACMGPTTYYRWNGYDETLYRHYKSPQDRQAWVEGLKAAILAAEQAGERMPPGLYAEYGYALFEEGDAGQAVVYFQKEQALWPESRFLMEKMVRNAEQRGRQARPPAQGPAGALEKS